MVRLNYGTRTRYGSSRREPNTQKTMWRIFIQCGPSLREPQVYIKISAGRTVGTPNSCNAMTSLRGRVTRRVEAVTSTYNFPIQVTCADVLRLFYLVKGQGFIDADVFIVITAPGSRRELFFSVRNTNKTTSGAARHRQYNNQHSINTQM
uniref:Uncharacterized protein n=1 Tax=Halimeda minima TaxID=170427 RepID=A0A386AYY6_9CHLO|nr:hypothetical protein [Halimeda minima]